MAVFIELVTDQFEELFASESRKGKLARTVGAKTARRPLRGLEIKEETYAILKVLKANGEEIELLSSSGKNGRTTSYTDFILQGLNEARMEKHQIIETFGEPYVYFFGEQPRFVDVSAVLINSNDFQWVAQFWENYERYLRGTRCAEIGARVYLYFEDVILSGYLVMASAPRDANNPMMVPLQFRIFVTDYQTIALIGDASFPAREGYDPSAAVDTLPEARDGGTSSELTSEGFIRRGNNYTSIYDNVDEWTGPREGDPTEDELEIIDPTGTSGDHPDELPVAMTREAEDAGASLDSADSLKGLGVLDGSSPSGPGSFGIITAPSVA